MGASLNSTDNKGFNSLYSDLERILYGDERGYLKVGIISDPKDGIDASTIKQVRDKDDKIVDSKQRINVVQVAAVHEFGSEKRNIPQRSFLRSTINEERDKIPLRLKQLARVQLRKNGELNHKLLLMNLGSYLVGRVRLKFRNNDWPPLQNPRRGRKEKVVVRKATKTTAKKVKLKTKIKRKLKKIKNKLIRKKGVKTAPKIKTRYVTKIKMDRPLIDTGQLRQSTGFGWVKE